MFSFVSALRGFWVHLNIQMLQNQVDRDAMFRIIAPPKGAAQWFRFIFLGHLSKLVSTNW